MIEKNKLKTIVELGGKLDQLTQNELAKIAGGEQSSLESEGIPYNPPPPPPVL